MDEATKDASVVTEMTVIDAAERTEVESEPSRILQGVPPLNEPTDLIVVGIGDELRDNLADLKAYQAFRDELDKFIKSKFTKGVHYGPPYEGCKKDTILLPGAQAIARLTKTKPMFFPDMELFEMMGRTPGVIVMKCYLVPMTRIPFIADQVMERGVEVFEPLCKLFCLAEGRGGGYVAEKKNKLKENMVVKMTQIRALRDAAVRVADLSDKYDQDTDEYSKEELGFFDTVAKEDKPGAKETTTKKGKETTTKEAKDVDILGEDPLSDSNLDKCPLPKDATTNPLADEGKDDEMPDGEL